METWRYAESILHIDLTCRTARVEETSLDLKRQYVGGAGFVARLLADSSAGRQSGRVVLAAGPLSDEAAGRLTLGARLPLRQSPAVSSLGGRMAAALKLCGFDALVIDGELDRPGLLVIEPDGVQVVDGAEMAGMEIPAAEQYLSRMAGPFWATILLGPAAESAVPFATLAHEGHYAGGSGVAAALGAKRLKAVLVRGGPGMPARCTGCSLACAVQRPGCAERADALGLDGPEAARWTALAAACAESGLLPRLYDPLEALARTPGLAGRLAQLEEKLAAEGGAAARSLLEGLPARKKRAPLSAADLLGTCRRMWRERPGAVLRTALAAARDGLAGAM